VRAREWMDVLVVIKNVGIKKKYRNDVFDTACYCPMPHRQKRKNGSRDDPDARIEKIVLPRVTGALSRVFR